MEILVVIDMQNDFINGVLGTKEAENILPKVKNMLESFQGTILFTRDTHDEQYLNTQEGKHLPVVHCVEGTSGWQIAEPLQKYITQPPLDKKTFGSLDLVDRIAELHNNPQEPLTITLLGLCTDICVISNAMILKPAFPEATIQVLSDCCAGVTVESHENALSAMKLCQISVV